MYLGVEEGKYEGSKFKRGVYLMEEFKGRIITCTGTVRTVQYCTAPIREL
jgi:hypothetical protein